MDKIFDLGLQYETTDLAIEQRKSFLARRGIGVCDIVASCMRDKVDASDLGMQEPQLRNLIGYLRRYSTINTLIFTGGNSKNGPEYFFRKHLKEYKYTLKIVSDKIPRVHEFVLRDTDQNVLRTIQTVSLTAPSGSANRAIGSMKSYKCRKDANPEFNTIDFRVLQYREWF